MNSDIVMKTEHLTILREEYSSCTKCPKLCETRDKIVFGAGTPSPNILVIAEAPGVTENTRGFPLIGDSGRVLDYLLSISSEDERLHKLAKSFSFSRGGFGKNMYIWPDHEKAKTILCESIFYTNVIMCWPGKGNRDPETSEIENCKERLLKTIYITDPKLIISVGAFAAKTIMNKRSFSIMKERGRINDAIITGTYTQIKYPIMPILHPSYLMRNPDFETDSGIWASTKNDIKKAYKVIKELKRCWSI